MASKHRYSPFDEDDTRYDAPIGRRSHRALGNVFKDRMIGAAYGLIVAMAIFLTLYHYQLPKYRIELPRFVEGVDSATGKPASWFGGSCGRSASEARARGCRFDGVLHSWLPSECIYEEDLKDQEEFMKMSNWKYYEDPQRSKEVSRAQVLQGDALIIYTSFRWHLVHCTFVWRRLHRALIRGRNIDSYIANSNHTHHCSEMLLLEVDPQYETTRIFTKFPVCG